MFFEEASMPVTSAPSLLSGSHTRPPPQPISNTFNDDRGFSIFVCNFSFMSKLFQSIVPAPPETVLNFPLMYNFLSVLV